MKVVTPPNNGEAPQIEVVYIDKPETQQEIIRLKQDIESLTDKLKSASNVVQDIKIDLTEKIELSKYQELLANYNQVIKDLSKERGRPALVKEVEKIVEVVNTVEVKVVDLLKVKELAAKDLKKKLPLLLAIGFAGGCAFSSILWWVF